jgi:hypothetical protein
MSTSVPLINVSLALGKADLDRFVPKSLTIPGPERKDSREAHAGSPQNMCTPGQEYQHPTRQTDIFGRIFDNDRHSAKPLPFPDKTLLTSLKPTY